MRLLLREPLGEALCGIQNIPPYSQYFHAYDRQLQLWTHSWVQQLGSAPGSCQAPSPLHRHPYTRRNITGSHRAAEQSVLYKALVKDDSKLDGSRVESSYVWRSSTGACWDQEKL